MLYSDNSFGKLELVLAFWIWILACLLGLFTIDVTQHDILPYPLANRPYHVIYGHGQPLKD